MCSSDLFVGAWSPVSLGDYIAGSNHVLPTGGCACHSSGLSVQTFLKGVHVIDYSEVALKEVADHGWEFCDAYLKLVLYIMGRDSHDALKASFKQHKVKFRKPVKRNELSPERKAELVARLAEYRVAKAA